MRHVPFAPDSLDGKARLTWEEWYAKSRTGTAALYEQHRRGDKIKYNNKVWRELKDWLLEHVFHKKCAYCESKDRATTHDAAEHWRPKDKVTVNNEVVELRDGNRHPGYWWLAYAWQNLVPSCDRCNGPGGKMNEFPVENEHVLNDALASHDLDEAEVPLLLHPYNEGRKPEDHLKFGAQGAIAARSGSIFGATSIRVFNLDRTDLKEERAEAQENADLRYKQAICMVSDKGASLGSTVEELYGPEKRYSQAVKAVLTPKIRNIRKYLK
ncbi:MAG: hypothetical protein GY838_09955 [bacterium]|nr:hypothetical protein [bacterium]